MANNQKKILMLGGLRYLIPVIQAAHELGYYVITCDYLPHNVAHKYADEYHNISITDKNAVLELAKELTQRSAMRYDKDGNEHYDLLCSRSRSFNCRICL